MPKSFRWFVNFPTHPTAPLANMAIIDFQSLSKRSMAKFRAQQAASWAWDGKQPSLAQSQQSRTPDFTSRSAHITAPAILICLPWQKDKCLESFFYIRTDKKMKHLRSLSRLWVSHTSSNKNAACKQGLSRNCPVSILHHISTAGPGEAAGSAGTLSA